MTNPTKMTIPCPVHGNTLNYDEKWASYYCLFCDWDYLEDGTRNV